MSKRSKNIRMITLSDFYCTKCGCKGIPIFRTIGKEKEPGHLKKLFCLNCQEERNMVEVRQNSKYGLDNFLIEYENGNFDEDGNRKEPWKLFIIKDVNKNE